MKIRKENLETEGRRWEVRRRKLQKETSYNMYIVPTSQDDYKHHVLQASSNKRKNIKSHINFC